MWAEYFAKSGDITVAFWSATAEDGRLKQVRYVMQTGRCGSTGANNSVDLNTVFMLIERGRSNLTVDIRLLEFSLIQFNEAQYTSYFLVNPI